MAQNKRTLPTTISTKVVVNIAVGDLSSVRIIEDTFTGADLAKQRNKPDLFWLTETVNRYREKKGWSPDRILSFEGKVSRK